MRKERKHYTAEASERCVFLLFHYTSKNINGELGASLVEVLVKSETPNPPQHAVSRRRET
jgi:hypothetical protein